MNKTKGPGRYYYASIAAVAAFAFLAYANTLANGFVFDDTNLIVKNPWIKDPRRLYDIFTTSVWSFSEEKELSKYYRPVVYLIYTIEHMVFGLKPWGWHLVNVLLHVLTSVLVFLVAIEIYPARDGSGSGQSSFYYLPHLSAALLFATHPVHTEVVAWVSALSEISFAMFYLLSLLFYLRYTREDSVNAGSSASARSDYILSLVFFFLSTLCKEPAMTLPVLLVVYDYSRSGRSLLRRWPRYVPYAALGILYLLIRISVMDVMVARQAGLSTFHWLINTPPVIVKYIGKIIYPSGLNAYYFLSFYRTVTAEALLYIIIVAAIGLALFLLRRRRSVFAPLALFFVPLLPALYLPGLMPMVFAERYVYLPSAGLLLLVVPFMASILRRYGASRRTAYAVLAGTLALAFIYGAATFERNRVWRDDYSLWTDTVGKSPNNGAAFYNLGVAAYDLGRFDESIAAYRKALALYRRPSDIRDTLNNLGNAYARAGMLGEALESFEAALRIDPSSAHTRRNLEVIRNRLMMEGGGVR